MIGIGDMFADWFGGAMGNSLAERIRLDAAEDECTLTMKDGTLVSVVRMDGAMRATGAKGLESFAEELRVGLSPFLSTPGHAFVFAFVRDPSAAARKIEKIVAGTREQAARLGLDLDDVLLERQRHLSRYLVEETTLILIHTRPTILSKNEAASIAARERDRLRDVPPAASAQLPGMALDGMFARHAALVESLAADLVGSRRFARVLDASEALQEIRAFLYPLSSPWKEEWQPKLPLSPRGSRAWPEGRRTNMRKMPESPVELAGSDFSNLLPPCLDIQLATEEAETLESGVTRIGDALFSGFDVTVAPEILTPFNHLVDAVTRSPERISWRCAFLVECGGLQGVRIKEQYARLFTFASPTRNARIRDAIEALRESDGVEDTVVRMRMSFATWVSGRRSDDLRRNAAILRRSVEQWGNASTDAVSCDHLATVLSSSAGLSLASTAPPAAAPLSAALCMGPFARQSGPWESGAVSFRTEDGRIWPYQPGSRKQVNWVDIFAGTPGSGKSVAMNALNFATALAAHSNTTRSSELPRISIIDIGSSSQGLISLVQEALPPSRRFEALHRKLRMEPECAINVFDTQPGMRRPLASERMFLANFLSLLCGDGENPLSGPLAGLVGAAIDKSYEDLSDARGPKRYLEGDEPEVDAALLHSGLRERDFASWWNAADELARRGKFREAEIAQRRAVPILPDLIRASHADQIVSQYGGAVDPATGQPVLAAFHRVVSEAIRDFPILASTTRFSIGSARISALDLAEITSGGVTADAKRRAALMFMMARHATTRDWFLDEAELKAAARDGRLPKAYLSRHLSRARACKQIPKLVCMDEFHRCGNAPGIGEQVVQDAREGRKHNVRISLASQMIDDFPDAVLDLASGVFIFNAPSEGAVRKLDEKYGLDELDRSILRGELRGPSESGCRLRYVSTSIPRAKRLGSNPGLLAIASTAPVMGSMATIAPFSSPRAVSAVRCNSASIVRNRFLPGTGAWRSSTRRIRPWAFVSTR